MDPLQALSSLSSTASALPMPATPPVSDSPYSEAFHFAQSASSNPILNPVTPSTSEVSGPTTWGHLVQKMVMDVNQQQQVAADKVSDVLQGGATPVHEAVLATQDAGLSFTFLAEVRNKVIESYQEVMRMQM